MSYIPEKLLKVTERPGDYWRDGLLYCGKCNTPRSCRIDLGGGERVVPSLCKCDRDNEAAEAEKAQTDLENTLAATQAELEKTTTALTQAEATAASLEEKLQDIEPEAASWQRIKDTAGGIEVAAHERAQVTLQTARAQAAEIRAEGTRWVWDIQSRCQQLQRDLHDAIVSAETELDEVRTAFHRAQAHMEGVQDALSHLVSGTEETEKNHKG